jgi:hypothetical protein
MRLFKALVGSAVFILVLGGVIAGWIYFDRTAITVPAKVVDKQEGTLGGRYAGPRRYLHVSFEMTGASEEDRYLYGSPRVSSVLVEQAIYDAHDVGTPVNVRYLPAIPTIVRLEGQPLLPTAFWRFGAAALVVLATLLPKRTRGGVALCVGLLAAFLTARPGPPPVELVLTASLILGATVAALSVFRMGRASLVLMVWAAGMIAVLGLPAARAASTTFKRATGQVREVESFTFRTSSSRKVPLTLQEFDRVQAEFLPDGADHPSVAVDFIDHDSVAGLAEGATAAVEYDPTNLRRARLAGGTRTHYWKNAMVPAGAVIGLAWVLSRKRASSAKTTPVRTGPSKPSM